MTGLEIFLIIFGIIVLIGVIIIIILVAAGVIGSKESTEVITGPFSMHPVTNPKTHLTVKTAVSPSTNDVSKYNLVLSNSTSISCTDYTWVYNSDTQTLTWKGVPDSPANVVVATSATENAQIRIIEASKVTDASLSQWIFDPKDFTWCLASTVNSNTSKKMCMFNMNGNIVLKQLALNTNFAWRPVKAITSPTCTV